MLTITLACVPLVPGTGLCYVQNLQMPGVTQDEKHQRSFNQVARLHIMFPKSLFVNKQLTAARCRVFNRIRVGLKGQQTSKGSHGRPRGCGFQNRQGMVR